MGGHCITHVAGHNAAFFRHLVLVDPVIFDPSVWRKTRTASLSVEDHLLPGGAITASVDEMLDRFSERMPYKVWQREV